VCYTSEQGFRWELTLLGLAVMAGLWEWTVMEMLPLYVFLVGIFVIASVFVLPTLWQDWRRARTGHK
jgi:hypothetical protein